MNAAVHGHGRVSRLRWALMPWWAFAWRYRTDFEDAPNPGRWWHHCIGSVTLWLDKVLERLPGGDLFEPMPVIVCDCDECRCTCLEYGHGMTLTRVISRACPVHSGEANGQPQTRGG